MVDRRAIEPRSGERFSEESVATPWLMLLLKHIPTAHAVGYALTALRASNQLRLHALKTGNEFDLATFDFQSSN